MDTVPLPDDLRMMHFELDKEFDARVKHNFKTYVLLSSKSRNWREEVILDSIFRFSGYKSHKTVKYGTNSSHIHVKFENEDQASKAVRFLNKLSPDLTAILVDDMLRDWFKYEVKSGFGPPFTFTVVDILGNPPRDLNFLTASILNSIFKDFGCNYYVSPYTAALQEPHVQVIFCSMTEAFAACMAFGEWYRRAEKTDSFFYRVRINPSHKEALLITNSGGIPEEAFKLDYFWNMEKEIAHSARRPESYGNQNRNIRYKTPSQNSGTRKVRKQKCVAKNEESQIVTTNQINPRTPIVCVPIIAPLNSFTETFGKQFGANVANALLDIQNSSSVLSRTVVTSNNSEMEIRAAIQYDNSQNFISRESRSLEYICSENNPAMGSERSECYNSMSLIPAKMVPFSSQGKKGSFKSQTRNYYDGLVRWAGIRYYARETNCLLRLKQLWKDFSSLQMQ